MFLFLFTTGKKEQDTCDKRKSRKFQMQFHFGRIRGDVLRTVHVLYTKMWETVFSHCFR